MLPQDVSVVYAVYLLETHLHNMGGQVTVKVITTDRKDLMHFYHVYRSCMHISTYFDNYNIKKL